MRDTIAFPWFLGSLVLPYAETDQSTIENLKFCNDCALSGPCRSSSPRHGIHVHMLVTSHKDGSIVILFATQGNKSRRSSEAWSKAGSEAFCPARGCIHACNLPLERK
jgi:hypothetical protein